ncbi:hypothetical protein [Microbacterium sp. XT11]|nr:hypothetical protein [Microbacterium sp. XT11]
MKITLSLSLTIKRDRPEPAPPEYLDLSGATVERADPPRVGFAPEPYDE